MRSVLLALPAARDLERAARLPGVRRSSAGSSARPSASSGRGRSSSLSDAPYGERRNPSPRFLPPDPSVSAPVPAHAGARGPGRRARDRRDRRLRAAVLPALVAPGALGRALSRRGPEQPAAHDQGRGAARPDPRPRGQGDRRQRAGDGGQALGRRHAEEGGALPDDQAPRGRARRADAAPRPRGGRARRVDPLTPITVKTAVHDDQVYYLQEHASEFPGVQIQQTYLRSYPYQSLGAQFLGYVGEISPAELKAAAGAEVRLPRRRQDRQVGGRGDVRRVPARHVGRRADPRRLARPAAEPARDQARRPARASPSG